MTRRFLTFALFFLPLLIACAATAQPPDTLWTWTLEYPDSEDNLYCVRPTNDGGLIVCGTTDYGPGYRNAWVTRLDKDANEVWSQLNSGGVSESANYIEQTRDGGFIECGETLSYSPYQDWDAYVRKLDGDGNQIWARTLGGDGWLDYALCVREVPAGGYVLFGGLSGDLTLVRLGEHGGVLWQRPAPPEWAQAANFVEPTRDGGFLVGANYYNYGFGVAKFDHQGALVWQQQYNPEWAHECNCVRELPDQTIVACGHTYIPPNAHGWYVIRAEADGTMIWDDNIDLSYSQVAEEIWVTADGNFVVGGFSQNEQEVIVEYWLIKYDLDGNRLWQFDMNYGDISSVCQTRDGGYAFGGGVRPDIGYDSEAFKIIKTHPEVEITLIPETSNVPAQGMTLHYQASVSNILIDPTPMEVWAVVTTPTGNRLQLQQITVTLQPGSSFDRPSVPLDIPAAAPPGDYTYEIHIGDAPPDNPPGGLGGSRNMGLGSFTFTKVGGR